MTLQYTPGGDPSAVYYGTDTHASALLIGAALALACPLRTLAAMPAAAYQAAGRRRRRRDRRPGLGRRALLRRRPGRLTRWACSLAALGAAGLVAAAAASGVIAAITSWRPLRWVGVRSYGIYLWHWPVIALGTARGGFGGQLALAVAS